MFTKIPKTFDLLTIFPLDEHINDFVQIPHILSNLRNAADPLIVQNHTAFCIYELLSSISLREFDEIPNEFELTDCQTSFDPCSQSMHSRLWWFLLILDRSLRTILPRTSYEHSLNVSMWCDGIIPKSRWLYHIWLCFSLQLAKQKNTKLPSWHGF